MWKISAALLVTFSGISDALESSSTLLESRVMKTAPPNTCSIDTYEVLNEIQFKFVVSIGWKIRQNSNQYFHRCLGIMFSPGHAITLNECVPYGYRIADNPNAKLYVNFQRGLRNNENDQVLIDESLIVSGSRNKLAFIKLDVPVPDIKERIPSLQKTDFPDFRNKEDVCVDSMIGWNNMEKGTPMVSIQPFVKVPVSLTDASKCNADPQIGQFCVEPIHREQKVTMEDHGAPVLCGAELVGIIIRMEPNCALAVSVWSNKIYVQVPSIPSAQETSVRSTLVAGSSTSNRKRRI